MNDIGGFLVSVLPFAVLALVAFFVLRRGAGGGRTMICTRCDGTGQVNEKWPDPSQPDGWHRVEGVCPKCKGKGKL